MKRLNLSYFLALFLVLPLLQGCNSYFYVPGPGGGWHRGDNGGDGGWNRGGDGWEHDGGDGGWHRGDEGGGQYDGGGDGWSCYADGDGGSTCVKQDQVQLASVNNITQTQKNDSVTALARKYNIKVSTARTIEDLAANKNTALTLYKLGVTAQEVAPLEKLQMPSDATIYKIADKLKENPEILKTIFSDFVHDIHSGK